MVLPTPRGKYGVGVIEADVPAPTSVGVVPIVIYYPTAAATETAEQQTLPWIDSAHAEAVGKVQLKETFGAFSGGALMSTFGPMATGYARVRASVGAKPLVDENGQWPVAVLSHSLSGWRHINSTYLVEIASHGAVAIGLEHCDRSACLALSNNLPHAVLATYAEREDMLKAAAEHDTSSTSPPPEGADDAEAVVMKYRHAQCDQRRSEVIAALDGVEAALRARFAIDSPASKLCRVDRDVAVLGQSFGGASAASCILSKAHAHRFSHCLLYDPWIEGERDRMLPLKREDFDNPLSSSLKKLVIWRNGRSVLWNICKANWDALAAKSPEVSVVHDYADCGHFAQTDAPVVFESGPFAFLYKAIKGTDGEPDARMTLNQSIDETMSALDDGWFLVTVDQFQGAPRNTTTTTTTTTR